MKNEDKNIQNNNELEFEIEDISFDDATVKMDVNVDRKIDIQESISDDTPTFDNQPNQEIQNDMEDVSESNSGVNEENSISNVGDVPEEIDSSNDMVDTSDETEPSTQNENKEENDSNKLSNENDSKEQISDVPNKEKDKNEQPTEESKEKLNDESVDKKPEDESEKQTSQDKTDDEKTPSSSQENSQTQKNENNQPNSNENGGEKKEGVNDKNKTPENNNVRDNQNENNGGNVPFKKEENIPKSSADKKRDEAKQKQENRNRNNKPNNNGGQKGLGGIKNRAKNTARNYAQNKAAENPAVQKVQETKKKVEQAKAKVEKVKKVGTAIKAIVSFIGPVGFGIIFLVLIAALLITMFFIYSPGSKGSIEDANSRYSEADQKAIEKLKVLYDKYPNADSSLAMLTTLYPYFPELWGADVLANLKESSDPNNTEEDAPEEGDDLENIESDDTVQDDVYLSYFHKSKYRNKIKKLLRKMHNDGEDAYYEYLKNDYFNGNGYDDLFDLASDKEKLKELIIEDLKNNKDLFANYVYDNAVCASTLISAGQMDTADLLKGNVLVDLKMPGCSSMKNCSESYYDTYLTLEEYVKGVVYEEIADNTDVNQIAAQMVAAKTYTLSRREDSIKQDASTGAYVIPMLWSTADQDFCHTELGCNSDDIKAHYGYETGGDSRLMHGRNREPATEKQKALYEEAWELSKDVYVVDKDGTAASVGYYVGSGCKVGKCMDQSKLPNYAGVEYKSILSTFYTSYSLATVEGDKSNIEVRGTQVCTNANTNYTATRAKIAAFALDQVGKVPYYEGGLAVVSGFDGNDFGTDTTDDGLGNTKKGLGAVGFVNWVYWSVIDDNLGNTNDLDTIISQGFEVASDKLLIGDIGYSSDKTVVGIYAGDNKWVMEDAVTGNVVAKPDDRITLFVRHISFKNERYNYTIRQSKPTVTEWGRINSVDNLENALWPSSDFYIGECVWYVKFRSLEIINELKNNGSLTEKQYDNLYKKLKQKAGTAIEYSPNNSKGPAKYYSNSMNINDIRPGSFLVTTSNTSSAGHISVVESFDGQNITITDGWNGEGKNANNTCTKSNFDCFTFRTRTFTYDEYINTFSSSFRGYLYFLED